MNGLNEFSRLHCSAEWHIEKNCPSPAASIYNIAFRVAAKSGRWTVSYPTLAEYFHTSERTIGRAVHGLRDLGFFTLLASEKGRKVTYHPVHHKVWEQTHPGQCLEKIETPVYWEKDPLGQALFAQCDGRITFFYKNVLTGMRKTGLTDAEIVAAMKTFRQLDKPPAGQPWTKGFVGRFMHHLKSKNAE
jgi:hypothetical protein